MWAVEIVGHTKWLVGLKCLTENTDNIQSTSGSGHYCRAPIDTADYSLPLQQDNGGHQPVDYQSK